MDATRLDMGKVEAFAGQECFGAITLCKGERSKVAELAADLL